MTIEICTTYWIPYPMHVGVLLLSAIVYGVAKLGCSLVNKCTGKQWTTTYLNSFITFYISSMLITLACFVKWMYNNNVYSLISYSQKDIRILAWYTDYCFANLLCIFYLYRLHVLQHRAKSVLSYILAPFGGVGLVFSFIERGYKKNIKLFYSEWQNSITFRNFLFVIMTAASLAVWIPSVQTWDETHCFLDGLDNYSDPVGLYLVIVISMTYAMIIVHMTDIIITTWKNRFQSPRFANKKTIAWMILTAIIIATINFYHLTTGLTLYFLFVEKHSFTFQSIAQTRSDPVKPVEEDETENEGDEPESDIDGKDEKQE